MSLDKGVVSTEKQARNKEQRASHNGARNKYLGAMNTGL